MDRSNCRVTHPLVIVVIVVLNDFRVSSNPALILTPFLENGQAEYARNLSRVDSSDIFCGPQFETRPAIESYSGFLTVDKTLGNNMFFWFFPSDTNTNAPLSIWLNGGPGYSSMIGLFMEHGPVQINEDAAHTDCHFKPRPHSWVGLFSMIYIDNPVGTGFSFSTRGREGFTKTQEEYTNNLYSVLQQFYVLFPEYAHRDLYIGGQSYGGKYAPSLAHYIHTENRASRANISLVGIYLGGPFFDPASMSLSIADFSYSLGFLSAHDAVEHRERARTFFEKFLVNGSYSFDEMYHSIFPPIDQDMFYNFVSWKAPDINLLKRTMNTPSILKAVHANYEEAGFDVNPWHVILELSNDFAASTKMKLGDVMSHYKVLIYNGNYDFIVNTLMIEEALLSTEWSLQKEYNSASRSTWISLDREIRGYVTSVPPFCRVIVHGAGHYTPDDTPESCLDMMEQFVEHGCVRT